MDANDLALLGTNLAEVGTDCISRQAALDAINGLPKWIDTENGVCLDYADVLAVLSEHLPSAQPMRKKGKWIYDSPVTMKCDQCEYVVRNWFAKHFRYCPSCSADMRGGPNV